MLSKRSIGFSLLCVWIITLLGNFPSVAQEDAETAHITVENPADMTQQEANRIYDSLKQALVEGYAPAKMELIEKNISKLFIDPSKIPNDFIKKCQTSQLRAGNRKAFLNFLDNEVTCKNAGLNGLTLVLCI